MSTNASKTAARNAADNLFKDAIARVRSPLIGVSAISLVSNLLMLTGPMFMMLVYDKVLSSRSLPTLVALSAIALTLYVIYGLLESVRARLLARVGSTFDHRLAPRLFDATLRLPLHLGAMAKDHDPLQDLAQIRGFLMGGGPSAAFDLPWMPIYFGLLYIVHPVLGLTAVIGALFLVVATIFNEMLARATVQASGQSHRAASVVLSDARRNAEAAAAMSMGADLCSRWAGGYVSAVAGQRDLADHAGLFGAMTKTARFLLQSAMLAVGAYLVILGELSPGSMIAGSIIVSRALSPVDQAIAHWRSFTAALNSFRRLKILVAAMPSATRPEHSADRPSRSLTVRDLAIVPPGGQAPTFIGGSFELQAGDALGIIGPSGCGKSTLARTLVGAWRPARGEVLLDGAELSRYTADTLGDSVGYLPQDVSLFDGTIAENIARFRKGASTDEIVAAATLAGVHEMIVEFPDGYETPVGEGGMTLSGGQRQRIGLARAVFGDPFLVVLDEPNANLDPIGEESLTVAIQRLRKAGKIVVIVAHRPSAIFAANKILSLRNGRAEMFGPKQQVLKALFPRLGQPHKQAGAAKPDAIAAAASPTAVPARAPAPATIPVPVELEELSELDMTQDLRAPKAAEEKTVDMTGAAEPLDFTAARLARTACA